MLLKQIKILGFKSFADKIVVDFHEGITGIVGPNGCGKSNISDSFRWVLGETSAKSLRGKKMEDIIFAGTSSRKPLNLAEVSITLSEIGGMLPVDYEEIEITRRYHRSGESEFFLNRQPVRMKDIQNLLLDSGIGKSAFSIFEQGKIDQVIQYTPLERRSIFEEAAGILRFLQRKRETFKRLEQTEGNISRIKDIHKEVEKNIIILKKQAEQACLYKEKKAEYESLEKKYFVLKWNFFEQKNQEILSVMEEKNLLIDNGNKKKQELTDQLKEAKIHLEEEEHILRKKSEEVYQARSDKEVKIREKQSNLERIKETESKELRWKHELENLVQKSSQRIDELKDSFLQIQKIKEEKEIAEEEFHEINKKVIDLELQLSNLRQKQSEAQNSRLAIVKEQGELESALNQMIFRSETTKDKIVQFTEQQSKIALKIKELLPAVQEKKLDLQKFSMSIDESKSKLASLDNEQEVVSDEINSSQKEFDKTLREHANVETRFKALKRMHEENEGFSDASKILLKESLNKKSAFYGKLRGLYEYIKTTKDLEHSVSTILRPYAQTLAVETKEDFYKVLEFTKKEKLEEFSLICLETIPESEMHKSDSFDNEIVPFLSEENLGKISHFFFKNIYIAKDSKSAEFFKNNKEFCSVWIKDGGFLDANNVLFYPSQGENNVFSRKVELKTLEQDIEILSKKKNELDQKILYLQENRSVIQSKRVDLDKQIRRDEMSLIEINFSLQRMINDLESNKEEEERIHYELSSLTEIKTQLSNEIKILENKLSEVIEKAKASDKYSESLASELYQHEMILQEHKLSFTAKERNFRTLSDNLRKIEHHTHVMEVQEEESQEQMRRMKAELELSRELQEKFQEKSSEFQSYLKDVEERLADVLEAYSEMEIRVKEKKNVIEKIGLEIGKQEEYLKKVEMDHHKLTVQSSQASAALSGISSDLYDRYQISIEQLIQLVSLAGENLDEVEKLVKTIRKELEQAQNEVNMTSIEEFERNKERFEFLNGEIGDMSQSRDELLSIIAKLDGESRLLFKETFETIRLNFQKNFKILFNGGEADLQFTEDGDLLEAGIEIIAKPPGKQMRSINLLSGGEKCMTALALLFAIFEVKPAPFCILDEIDAPLDDSNVERFVNLVKEFTDRCQFIIITHNKQTMGICDRLFGVSMQERGVSKLLSMGFNKEEARQPSLV